MINRVILEGRLVEDPQLRKTDSGVSVLQNRIAVDSTYKNKDGEKPQADFINVVIWRQSADFIARYAHKGTLISVDGKLRTRNYVKDGQKIYVTEVSTMEAYIVNQPKGKSDANNGEEPAVEEVPVEQALGSGEDTLPF